MAIVKQKSEVDFIPKLGINHDFMKIYNRTNAELGNIVLVNNLLNLIEMRKGINKEFPDIGLAQEFLRLSHIDLDKIDYVLSNIKADIQNQLGHEGIDLSYTVNDPESPMAYITVKLTIENIPGSIDIDVVNTTYNSKAIATKYSK